MVCTMPQAAIATVRVKLYPHVASSGRKRVVSVDLVSGIAGHTRDERCVFIVAVTDLDIIKAVFINVRIAVAPSWTILQTSKTTAMQWRLLSLLSRMCSSKASCNRTGLALEQMPLSGPSRFMEAKCRFTVPPRGARMRTAQSRLSSYPFWVAPAPV